MLVNVIDYSCSFFEGKQATVGSRAEIRRGKFVLLAHDEQEICVFSPIQQSEFHANIVERYSLQKGGEGHYNSKQDKYYLHDESWSVLGGGHWEYKLAESLVTLFGKSLAYGGLVLKPLVKELMGLEAFDGANILAA